MPTLLSSRGNPVYITVLGVSHLHAKTLSYFKFYLKFTIKVHNVKFFMINQTPINY